MDGSELYGKEAWRAIVAGAASDQPLRPPFEIARRRQLPALRDFPIPPDVRVENGWTEQMVDMAGAIGPRSVLLICDAFGGSQVYVNRDGLKSPFAGVIPRLHLYIMAHVFGGVKLLIPRARAVLDRARRAGIIAAVRAGDISGGDAARIIGTSRTYLAHIVNATDEGRGISPSAMPKPFVRTLLERAVASAVEELEAAGVDEDSVDAACGGILALDANVAPPPPIFPSDMPPPHSTSGIPSPHSIPNED